MANSTVCSAVVRSVMRHLLRRSRVPWRGFAISPVMCIFSIMVVSGAVLCVGGFVIIPTKGNPTPNDSLSLAHEWDKGTWCLDMTFRFSFSDIFRVAHTYFMPSYSFQHCHRARLHPAHYAFAQPRLGCHYRLRVIHRCVVSIPCHALGLGTWPGKWVNKPADS